MPRSAEVASRLILERAPWDAIDSGFELRIPFDSPHESTDLLARMVREGSAASHRLVRDGVRVGLLVTRCEQGTAGRELVLVAAFADDPSGSPLSDEISAAVEAMARAERCVTIRFHTVRPAAARRACELHGYRVTEIVCRKNLTDG